MKRPPRARAAVAAACLLAPCGAAAQAVPADVEIAEVFYDAVGGDDQLEWVELVNAGDVPVDLAGWSLGWGGADWTSGRQALEGVVDAGARFVVGGPLSTADDASPVFDLAVDLEPDLQNSGATADGVALFAVPADAIAADTLPVDVVVYGEANTSGLVDPSGAVAAVDVADAPGGSSIERGADGVWRVQPAPTPGAPPAPVPEPSRLVCALGATLGVGAARRSRAKSTS
jgi:lamin tail-like protein